jgi:hypothetical protein
MKQQTLFFKSKDSFLYSLELQDRYNTGNFGNEEYPYGSIGLFYSLGKLSDRELLVQYSNLFRCERYEEDGTHLKKYLSSKEECYEFIDNEENKIKFGQIFYNIDNFDLYEFDLYEFCGLLDRVNRKHFIEITNTSQKNLKREAMVGIDKFWKRNPNGVIFFRENIYQGFFNIKHDENGELIKIHQNEKLL